MTNNELRIAVAEARGWGEIVPGQFGSLWGVPKILTEQRVQVTLNGKTIEEIPNYPDSMDACMELIEEMTNGTGLFLEIHVSALMETPADKYYVALRRFDYDYSLLEEMPLIAECTAETMSRGICWIYKAWKEGE